VPTTIWLNEEVGNNREAKQEINRLFGEDAFPTPKPERLIQRVLRIATDPDDLVMDSFAGSGTTGAVAQKMGRRWIMVEMAEHCRTHIAPRLKKVVEGEDGGISKVTDWKGGSGFRYCKLGAALFDEAGNIAGEVRFSELAAHVFFTETGNPIPKRADGKTPLLGVYQGRAVYLLFNGVLGDRRPAGGNVLTHGVAQDLPDHPDGTGLRVVYGEACRLGSKSLARYGIAFRQIPFELKVD
jgi:adenine-specific DNA-methyltransferase